MTDNDVKQVTLTLNTAQAEQKLGAITQRLEEARQKKTQAFEQGNAKAYTLYAQETKKLEQQQQRLISRTQTVTRTLQSLDKATPRDLRTAITQINRQLNSGSIERGSKEWNTLTQAMAEAKNELKKITDEQKAFADNVDKSWVQKFGEKWSGFVVTIQGVKDTIDSVISSISKYVDEYAQMQEHTASVTKYTGLAKEEVDKLNESFQRMDTATPRAKLNDLAADAGRLGIQSRQSVQEFVEAADQINTALGDDLGEDAVKNIGKLAQLFGDSDRMGLKQAMLSTGSVINELAQSSSASEGYLMEFTARLAGVGKQANLTQAQVMAFGSVLDQNMVGVEKGATALQNVIVALFAKPEKMAKAARLNVQKFTNLLKTDANAAILQFVQALQQTGGFDRLAPLLKEMHLSGSGVTQTLSALANNLDNLKQTQQQATQAFREGTSCTNEAAFANSNVAAQLEKAQQQWADLRIELGERLAPIYITTTNAAFTLVQKLRELKSVVTTVTKFVADNRKEIIATAVGLATFTIAVKAHTIATRAAALVQAIQTAAVAAYQAVVITCTAAQTALNAAIKSNGFTAIISLILSAAAALITYLFMSDKTTDSTKQLTRAQDQATEAQRRRTQAQKALSDAQAQAASSANEEKARITSLTTLIHDNTASIQARRAAIAKLQQVIPSYHASISETGTLMEKNKTAIDDYITSLDKLALAEAIFDKIKENLKQQIDIDMAIDAWNKAIARRQAIMQQEGHESDEHTIMMNGKLVTVERNYKRRYDNQMLAKDQERYQYWIDRDKDNKATNAALHKLAKDRGVDTLVNKMIAQGSATTPKPTSPTTTSTGETEAQRKARIKREKQLKKEETERLRKQKKANKAAEKEYDRAAATLRQKTIADYASGATDLIKYRETLQSIEENTIQAKRDIYAKDTEEWKSHNDELLRVQQQHDRKSQDWSIEDLNRKEKAELQQAALDNARGLTTEEAYQEQRNRITVDYLQRRMDLYKEYGRAEDFERTREQLTDTLNTQKLEKQKAYLDKLNTMRNEYEQKSATERMQIELKMLQAVYEATDETGKRISTMTEAEYNRLKKLINLKYLGTDGKVNTDGTITPGTTGEAHDDLQSRADKALSQARSTKGQEIKPVDTATDWGFSSITSAAYKIKAQKETYDALKKMRADNLIDEQTYQEACKKLDQERYANLQALAEAAYSSVSAIMSSASSLFTAQQQLEEAQVTKRYDAEIQKVGSNTKKGKKLEEQKQKELAQIKTKYNKKQMKIELAQAVATTAMNALKAYGAMAGISVVGPALGAIAAAAAIAAGAIQIASIKKQHAAEQEGYYSGGYTGGTSYHLPAGTVHQGEFVANHQAVRNPAIRPVLDLIDQAQRTNRIATLTPTDVSRAIAAPQATAAATTATMTAATQTAVATTATAANAPQTTQIITTTTQAQTDTLRRLADQLDRGITATVTIDGPDGLDRQYRKYQRLNNI